ncbi:MAG: carboxypeptidase regulatory-like domain-containing protein [Bryobacterales bacterium]|nr:carboxypeptidase regulatory-like domain-containing protein [Bryobacterales bacterium]
MTIKHWGLAFAVPLLLLCGRPADAQVALSGVTGSVTDSANVPMAGARAEIRNTGTGIKTGTESNESGYFTLVGLIPGEYELTVEAEGFQPHVRRDLRLETGQQVRLDIQLELRAVRESITVTSGTPAINLEDGATMGDVIMFEEIQDLPLLGREFTELSLLIPGVVPSGGDDGSFAAINGARADQTNFYVDGMSNRDPMWGGQQVRPPMDAVQEFRVETSGFSAEYGGFSGGMIGMTMRSGSNEVHGSAFWFLRNEFLNARRLFAVNRERFRRDMFGGTVSGPIVKNKAFFLISYEGRYNSQQQTRYGRVPTALERTGDFSNSGNVWSARRADGSLKPLYLNDPGRRGACNAKNQTGCFPNMTIPLSRQEQAGRKLMDIYPLPSEILNPQRALNQRLNHYNVAQDDDLWHKLVFKVDQNLTSRDMLSVSYQQRLINLEAPFAGSPLATWGNLTRNRRSLLSVRHSHTFSPRVILQLVGGFSRQDNFVTSLGVGEGPATFGLPVPEDLPAHVAGLPRVTVNGFWPLGPASGTPNEAEIMNAQASATLSWSKSSHAMKTGFNFRHISFDKPVWENVRGTYVFNQKFTNHSVGDVLLGQLTQSNRRVQTTFSALRSQRFGMFFTDNWKVTRHLTLNLGVRYEVNLSPYDKNDRLSNYRADLNQVVYAGDRDLPNLMELLEEKGLAGRAVLASEVGMGRRLIDQDLNNFAPRLGIAWRPFGDTKHVVRSGYGIFYQGYLYGPVRNQLAGGFPFTFTQIFGSAVSSGAPLPTIRDPYPELRAKIEGLGTNHVDGFDPDPPSSYLQRWNLAVERDMGRGRVVSIAYVGSKGTHLQRRYNLNVPIRRPEVAQIGANGNYVFPRPHPEFNRIMYNSFGGNSFYNSLQASLRKRSSWGFFYRVNYSFGKALDDASTHTDGLVGTGGALDTRNLKLDRGRSNFDRRHVFTVATRYRLPIGMGEHFLPGLRGPRQAVLGGWRISSTLRVSSGPPFTVLSSNVDLNAGESRRPNRIGDGYQPPNAGPGRKGIDFPWYDVTAFERVPCFGTKNNGRIECPQSAYGFEPFQPGNSGRNILDQPGQFRMNLSLQKEFEFEHNRRLQVRLDASNALNLRQLGLLGLAARQFDGAQGGFVATSRPARRMQVSLRYRF